MTPLDELDEDELRDAIARLQGWDTPNEHLVQVGMRAAIRDVQDWLRANSLHDNDYIEVRNLNAYLLALLITAGAYDDLSDSSDDGQG